MKLQAKATHLLGDSHLANLSALPAVLGLKLREAKSAGRETKVAGGEDSDTEHISDEIDSDNSSSESDDTSAGEIPSPHATMKWKLGRCSVHTFKDDLPPLSRHMTGKGRFKVFMNRFQRAAKFPGEWFPAAWRALARHYRRMGENKFIDEVEKNIVNPEEKGAFMMGWIVLGLSHNNFIEQSNPWFRREISEELAKNPQATLPTSLPVLVEILKILWPRWVSSGQENTPFRVQSTDEKCQQTDFWPSCR